MRPPILYGDVSRPGEWLLRGQRRESVLPGSLPSAADPGLTSARLPACLAGVRAGQRFGVGGEASGLAVVRAGNT
ncbi:hypothetical protein [Actinokineospora sp. NBRC 105648]|uniref:hypothetical protein n=1 Tax=Actinokineospora sp. NBRC 105648 TaxID=3032206 RepID=UPI0024A38132|nr:hypothetical protein [Actinokineospora sp. NBRC 105648]GLZ39826.1 hypothetical protein Acsp05_34500 [Actinokineospora sp. NBRC 105648]